MGRQCRPNAKDGRTYVCFPSALPICNFILQDIALYHTSQNTAIRRRQKIRVLCNYIRISLLDNFHIRNGLSMQVGGWALPLSNRARMLILSVLFRHHGRWGPEIIGASIYPYTTTQHKLSIVSATFWFFCGPSGHCGVSAFQSSSAWGWYLSFLLELCELALDDPQFDHILTTFAAYVWQALPEVSTSLFFSTLMTFIVRLLDSYPMLFTNRLIDV